MIDFSIEKVTTVTLHKGLAPLFQHEEGPYVADIQTVVWVLHQPHVTLHGWTFSIGKTPAHESRWASVLPIEQLPEDIRQALYAKQTDH